MAILLEHDSPCLVYKGHVQEVYDVTKFLDDHPGGDEVLLSATVCFKFSSLNFGLLTVEEADVLGTN
ncbi:hypothetical protein RJ640_021179 [Escallonia rubra]|uniref:Cytochrome b5 heme-binding domain-containing protein n=1 Tax=Escallonia rubra TaxID=112253 RepID=A0AA88QUM0_9ASTE|nr:hypothetical protein RJ640_021179 [Escallonia rubra]